ncbi:MAG: hypothetical protein KAX16_04910 [Actinomycetia bacterium]|nr:hypothetical protein [Actinomycetes bacterium]
MVSEEECSGKEKPPAEEGLKKGLSSLTKVLIALGLGIITFSLTLIIVGVALYNSIK